MTKTTKLCLKPVEDYHYPFKDVVQSGVKKYM